MLIDSFAGGWSTFHRTVLSGHVNQPEPVEFRLYVHGVNNVYESMGLANNGGGNEIAVKGGILTPSDATPPGAPGSLVAPFAQVRDTSVFLSWGAATDNLVVWGYNVYDGAVRLNGSLVRGLNFTVGELSSGNTYTFTVKAVDFVGNESSTGAEVSVRTNRQPIAAFTATPTSGAGPLAVTFDPSGSSDPDSGDYILGYVWDFGDGSDLDYSNAPEHVYQTENTFTASLTVVDSRDFHSEPVTQQISVGPVGAVARGTVPGCARRAMQVRVYDLAGRLVFAGERTTAAKVSGGRAAGRARLQMVSGAVRVQVRRGSGR
jgi:hypothetical protein